jgi:predicted O-linked N-acetylglucosamine transferase (SPINDLY family)
LLVVAVQCFMRGDLERPEPLFRRALEIEPGNAAAHHNLGNYLLFKKRVDEATAHFRAALAIHPKLADSHAALGAALLAHGDVQGAVSCFSRAVELNPGLAQAWIDLVGPLAALGRFDEAAAAFKRGAERDARLAALQAATVYHHLGTSFADYGLEREAVLCMEKSALARPAAPEPAARRAWACNALGLNAQHGGRLGEALTWFERALEADPDNLAGFSNYVWCLQYGDEQTPAGARDAAVRWAERRAPVSLARNSVATPREGRRLRIGYLSPDFWDRPPAYCVESLLESHDRERYEIFLYSASPRCDEVSERLRTEADHWCDISRMSDDEASDRIQEDKIDILVDLAGHTENNRIGVLARKPAPVQAEWLGYYATTGLRQIDYFICDPRLLPPEEEHLYVEKPMRLAGKAFSFKPPEEDIPVTALPALTSGCVTFGSHAYLAKVTPEVVKVWSDVLRAVPGSRFAINRQALAAPQVRARFAKLFAENGVEASRVCFQSTWTRTEHLQSLAELDVMLDTFPFNGGTSTYEALWMGVPVLTLTAPRMVGHFGEGILEPLGHADWVARTPEEFVAKACELASDLPRLAEIRHGLRDEFVNSPLCDAPAFTRELEDAFERMHAEKVSLGLLAGSAARCR